VNNEEWYQTDWLGNCDKGNRLKAEICTGRFQWEMLKAALL